MNDILEDVKDILRDNIEGMNKEEAVYYVENDAIPEAGSVNGLIFYSDTEDFAKRHYSEIKELLKENGISDRETLNEMAWVAWNLLLSEVADEVLDDIVNEIKVSLPILEAFDEVYDGVVVDLNDFLLDSSEGEAEVDPNVASEQDYFTIELKAYVKYNYPEEDLFGEIDSLGEQLNDASFKEEERVRLLHKETH